MTKPILAVSGITRSGTSMMMRMLHAGGMDVLADNHLAYEDHRVTGLPAASAWLEEAQGKAVKLLDPHQFRPHPSWKYVFIFMIRDSKEQAKSIRKFMRQVGGMDVPRTALPALRRSIKDDRPVALSVCQRLGPVMKVRFEDAIKKPDIVCNAICNYLYPLGFILDPVKMQSVVRDRTTACFKGMMEMELVNEG